MRTRRLGSRLAWRVRSLRCLHTKLFNISPTQWHWRWDLVAPNDCNWWDSLCKIKLTVLITAASYKPAVCSSHWCAHEFQYLCAFLFAYRKYISIYRVIKTMVCFVLYVLIIISWECPRCCLRPGSSQTHWCWWYALFQYKPQAFCQCLSYVFFSTRHPIKGHWMCVHPIDDLAHTCRLFLRSC